MWLHDSCMWLCDSQWVSESTDPRWRFNKTPPNGSVYARIYPSYRRLSLISRPTILSVLPSRWPIVALWLCKAIRRIRPVEVTEQMSRLDSKAFEILPFLLTVSMVPSSWRLGRLQPKLVSLFLGKFRWSSSCPLGGQCIPRAGFLRHGRRTSNYTNRYRITTENEPSAPVVWGLCYILNIYMPYTNGEQQNKTSAMLLRLYVYLGNEKLCYQLLRNRGLSRTAVATGLNGRQTNFWREHANKHEGSYLHGWMNMLWKRDALRPQGAAANRKRHEA